MSRDIISISIYWVLSKHWKTSRNREGFFGVRFKKNWNRLFTQLIFFRVERQPRNYIYSTT